MRKRWGWERAWCSPGTGKAAEATTQASGKTLQTGRQRPPGADQKGLTNQEKELRSYSQHSRTPGKVLESDGI